MVVYFFVYPRVLHTALLVICNIRSWFASLGYSLCFGTINAKMWRVYYKYIFHNPKPSRRKKRTLTRKATQLVLDSCPSVTVDYCLTHFKSHLEQWKGLMVAILRRIEEDTSPELESTYRSVYQGVLGHIVTLTSPEEFLDLLPPRGSLDFFLPFMEHSCKLFVSHQVAERLNTSVNHSSSS